MAEEFDSSMKQAASLIGSKVELLITSGLYKGTYPSTLQEIDNENGGAVGVSHPTLKGAFLPALRGTELLMKIEGSGGIHQAPSTVVRSVLNADVPLLWMKFTSPLEKVQRRMFVRVPSAVKADAFFLETTEELPEGVSEPSKEWFSVRISDISLGGIGISIKENLLPFCLESGRYLLSMKIGDHALFIVGKIVKILTKRENSIEIGFAYEGLPIFTEKIMVGYVRQQELIMRG